MKVLGTTWDMNSDSLFISRCDISASPVTTKREALQFISKIYDPLGFLSPVALNGKLFIQELWQQELDWDETLNFSQQDKWCKLHEDLLPLSSLPIPRYIGGDDYKLFCFSDASAKAYSAAVYLYSTVGGTANVNLIFSKVRVAPTKHLSIPRLELLAVLIGARALNYVANQLQAPVTDRILWTDSQCVLHWMKSNKPLPTFVQNRLKEISSNKDIKFRYISTSQNPADLATRGLTANELIHSNLWWYGPAWLNDDMTKWPSWDFQQIYDDTLQQLAKHSAGAEVMYETSALTEIGCQIETASAPIAPFELNETDYSSLTRLLRVTAWALRFTRKLQKKSTERGELTVQEISQSKLMWETYIQKSNFASHIHAIKSNKRSNLKHQLGLELDENGLLRCHGRLISENLPQNTVYPKLLPKNNAFTNLVIISIQEKSMHAGVSHTLSAIRSEYWVPQGRAAVRRVLISYRRCRRFQGGPYKMPNMAPYPPQRVEESPPFSYTGLDYLGPLYVKVGTEASKIWVCLFTYLAVRAIHLEIIRDMTANQFLLCLRRFIARHGKPKLIISDNAPQFKLTKSALDEAWQSTTAHPDTQSY